MKYEWKQFDGLIDWIMGLRNWAFIISGVLVFFGIVTKVYQVGVIGVLLLGGYYFFMIGCFFIGGDIALVFDKKTLNE